MILQGSIERFDLGTVLQFLALNAATGIVEVRDREDYGHIYLVKGRLEAISLPLSDDRLGIHLVKSGLLNEANLTRVLMEEAGQGDGVAVRKPLGQRLVEKGFTSETVVRQAMCRLTMARMFELAHWHSGVFTYDEPQHMPRFDISIRGDVQELLLQTQIRIDHGEKPRKRASVQQDDLCYRCPVSDCSPAIRLKYLKKDLCLWRQMSSLPDVRTGPGHGVNPLYAEEDSNDVAVLDRAWAQF
jgi:Domain of unknown function (DUF4388)